ncbi:hypothetical protein BGZ72_009382 [Mortierella alpina]|nr:hypothetical protein BGZ72_009382 [Mortierella alpina]
MPFETFDGHDNQVHRGSKICLRHLVTGNYIRSSAVKYEGGSGQQIVYARSQRAEHEDWWQALGPDNKGKTGDVIHYGDMVRLYHMATFKWLHSHNVKSPASGQNEVSAHGSENTSDANDLWIVEKVDGGGNGQAWNANDMFLLRHKETGAFLHSHNIQITVGGLTGNEVTTVGTDRNDKNHQFNVHFG